MVENWNYLSTKARSQFCHMSIRNSKGRIEKMDRWCISKCLSWGELKQNRNLRSAKIFHRTCIFTTCEKAEEKYWQGNIWVVDILRAKKIKTFQNKMTRKSLLRNFLTHWRKGNLYTERLNSFKNKKWSRVNPFKVNGHFWQT